MYEYKVDIYKVKYAEDAMNTYAKEGWRVIAVTPDHHSGFLDVFYEREAYDHDADIEYNDDNDEISIEIVTEDDEDDGEAEITDEEEAEADKVTFAVPDDIWDYEGDDDHEESEDDE